MANNSIYIDTTRKFYKNNCFFVLLLLSEIAVKQFSFKRKQFIQAIMLKRQHFVN